MGTGQEHVNAGRSPKRKRGGHAQEGTQTKRAGSAFVAQGHECQKSVAIGGAGREGSVASREEGHKEQQYQGGRERVGLNERKTMDSSIGEVEQKSQPGLGEKIMRVARWGRAREGLQTDKQLIIIH